MSEEIERAKAYLKQANADGRTLYDHLADLLLSLLKEKPDNAYDTIEQLSVGIKKQYLAPKQYKELPVQLYESSQKKQLMSSVNHVLSQLKLTQRPDSRLTVEEKEVQTKIADLLAHAELWEITGLSLGAEQHFQLQLSIAQLCQRESLTQARFWGKILGTQADYYIVETKLRSYAPLPADFLRKDPKIDPDAKLEWAGSGVNEYVYYVTNSLQKPWVRLPDLRPEQLTTARALRRFFTGDLTAAVHGYPSFPWGEAALLRATVARIAAATSISPKGFYLTEDGDDDKEVMLEDEEYAGMSSEELMTTESWVHHYRHVLKIGRTDNYTPPERDDDEEEEEEPEEEEEEEPEEPIPLLTEISTDESAGLTAVWSFRVAPRADNPHATVRVSSNVWPGAYAVAKGALYSNLYIGYGQKYLPTVFTPESPPAVLPEYVAEFNPEDDEVDPMIEQEDPLPPPELPEDHEDEDEDNEDDQDEEEEEQERDDDEEED